MKRILLFVLAIESVLCSAAQVKPSVKKYPSLFWEITGNGLLKPSYLFGTMHVSSKIVFHLPDSFYVAIRNVDMVALETNPESWQEDLVKYDLGDNSPYSRMRLGWNNYRPMPDDYLNIRSLQFDRYEKQIEAALYSRPSTINNLLYRNYSEFSSDFEENTYLDMYIYQVGKKMDKRVAGVEKYEESMKLMMEAYRDAAKEKNHKQKSYDNSDDYSADKLQEAYRTGNLDLLDSINRVNSFSDAFDEKFLYSRNLLQANSIDSILRSRTSLFVGVGAAHLPGSRGVIEILRKKGYRLRPIVMGERDGNEKDRVEKLRVPVAFHQQSSDDGFIKVDIPGKFYRFNEDGPLDQLQYADMANGSYYMITRVKTNGRLWGHNDETVKKKIDSLLYENIPGKILSRQEILRNGYHGFDIMNRTRRGDVQRYNIFITPFEVIIFKMSGNGDYVKNGDESKRFFGSIQLKDFATGQGWKLYEPRSGGFSVELPHEPFVSRNLSWEYESEDKTTGTTYTIVRSDIHNYSFAGEDTLDLDLLGESFSGSEFIRKEISRTRGCWNGYPSLDCKYQHKDGSLLLTRFLLQGPHYYMLIAQCPKENGDAYRFLNSFQIKPFIYKEPFKRTDTLLHYTVTTTFYPEAKKIKLIIPGGGRAADNDDDNTDSAETGDGFYGSRFRNAIIENDSTGEKVYVSVYRNGRYFFSDDSSMLNENRVLKKSSWIIRSSKRFESATGWRIAEFQLSDTNSSRLIWTKSLYRNGISYLLATEGDTLTAFSSFIKDFFETFTPDSSLKGFNPMEKKSAAFFKDFFASDSTAHRRAIKSIDEVKVDSADLPNLEKALLATNWTEKKYLDTKKSLISKFAEITAPASSDFLKRLYYAEQDTVDLQYEVLESLLQQQTNYAFQLFAGIIAADPPILDANQGNTDTDIGMSRYSFDVSSRFTDKTFDNSSFWDELYDSVQLTRSILPDLLPLLNLDDYKWKMMRLLERMIDSNIVRAHDYEPYFGKFLIEAKQEYRRQVIKEKKKLIKLASDKNLKDENEDTMDDDDDGYGNEKLALYATLLLPFWNSNAAVPAFFNQLLQSGDRKVKYSAMLLMLKSSKSLPDSLLNYFAAMDDYRYLLYSDLDEAGKLKTFPRRFNNQQDLAMSKLIISKPYSRPDSLVYVDKLPAEFNSVEGYIYFFKYKEKKDDLAWKLASVGLVSKDPAQFEVKGPVPAEVVNDDEESDYYDFTSYSESKINDEESIAAQLSRQLKRLLYSRRRSAKQFYEVTKNKSDEISAARFRN